jgi:hypothetical protein
MLGVQPPTPSWGTMIPGGRSHLLDAPHLAIWNAARRDAAPEQWRRISDLGH